MSVWNYVVTAHKPTNVTHSCVGNFTASHELNLIVAKCTRIEIHLLTPQGLQPMLDVPIYGRIATLELFRPHGETQDLLFIATERYKFCVLQWDSDAVEVITRAMGDVSDRIGRPTDNGQIGVIDPDCRLIGLHLYDGLFKVIPFDNKGQLKEAFNIRLEELQVLDIKFLHGCAKPTIVVLYQDNKDARHVKTYEVTLKDKDFVEGPWSQNNLDNGADLLIPVPPPLCGVLIIGEETIVYCSASAFKAIPITPSITRSYGRVDTDGSRYLLGDHNGLLHLLVITHEKEKVTGLKIELLGETSVASSISYLDNAVVFIGSSYGDSQLIKLNLHPDAKGSYVEVLERYVNLGPIVDFCVVDLERQGQGQVVTCSGAYKDGSLRIVRNGIGINEQASVELQGIKGMWSLRSATDDPFDTFLVVSFISETRILAMNIEDELEETEIEGFYSNAQTLFCHDAIYDHIVQVTSVSVRLVSSTSRELRHEWFAPAGYSINVATANATQMELKTPPACECGNGLMVLRKAGDFSTRPGYYYFICPAGLKHRNRFFWYDDYTPRNVPVPNETSSEIGSGSNTSQNHASYSSNKLHRNTHTNHASYSAHCGTLNNDNTFPRTQNAATDRVIEAQPLAVQNQSMKATPISTEQLYCCFGCICALLIVVMCLLIVVIISM